MSEVEGSVSVTPHRRLRERIASGASPLLLPGAPNALTARVLEEAGFEAVYLSGAGVANSFLGSPDIGLLSFPEIVAHLAATRDVVDLPLVVDADTGFGNALNVQRTVRALERAGASAIQLEDQVMPKRCGHFDGKRVIDAEEMVGKIKAAADARHDDDLLIIARTDAYAGYGLDEACDRAARYQEAGADVLFVEAPGLVADLAQIPARVPGRHLVNIVEGGRTPVLPLAELGTLGFAIVLYANTLMRAGMAAMTTAARSLREHGDSLALTGQIASWQTRQELVRLTHFDALDELYGGAQ
jgi:2-methylisocitrate lyase-like PEP mutase family enzyme